MLIQTQVKINNTKKYYDYLKENSYWIKLLNRSDNNFNKFNDFIKEKYSLRLSDKISTFSNNIDTINSMLNILK